MEKNGRQSRRQPEVIRIDVLPDDVLLEIFDFYMHPKTDRPYNLKRMTEAWQSLVHVSQRWRSLVLGSPRRLNLQLCCTPETPARDALDIWPAFPLIVCGNMISSSTDNVMAALKQIDRVCQVCLSLADWQLEQVLAAMEVPFPELAAMELFSAGAVGGAMPAIPDSFLDGSAPGLKHFYLDGIQFLGLPKLLLAATHLATLHLTDIPHSGYISPEAIIALISVLSCLKHLSLNFHSPQSCPDLETRRPSPSKRSVIPALISLRFKGVTEYLEDLVTGIDAPQLNRIFITFFNQIDFHTPQLAQFIDRTPNLEKHEATVLFEDDFASVELSPGKLRIKISCREPDWQLSSIEQVCNSSLHPLYTVEDLHIEHRYRQLVWKVDPIENTLWSQLLLPFTTVKNLYLSKESAPVVAAALQDLVGNRITEVFPNLQNIFVEGLEPSGPFRENIGELVATRQLSDHPIAISLWDKE